MPVQDHDDDFQREDDHIIHEKTNEESTMVKDKGMKPKRERAFSAGVPNGVSLNIEELKQIDISNNIQVRRYSE